MKPMKLEMEAIGPFLGETVIDFSRIGDNGLFLIHGDTGRGKSFIFDAMCYALYGVTPSGRESHLRSDFAAIGVKPWIRFSFRLNNKHYEVRRTLAYERKKKKGEGVMKQQETQSLRQLTDTPDGKPTTLATKKRDVDNKVRGLLGMAKEQFQQVVMLPQGEFRRLLLATTDERETLLERLFDSNQFDTIQRWVNQKVSDMRRDAAKIQTEIETLAKQALKFIPEVHRPADDALPDRHTFAMGLTTIDGQITQQKTETDKLQAELEKAVKHYQAAEILMKDFEALGEQTKTLAALENRTDEIDALRVSLKQAEFAETLRNPHTNREKAEETLRTTASSLETAEKDRETAKLADEKAREEAQAIPGLRKTARETRDRAAKLEPLVPLAEKRHELTRQITNNQADLKKAEKHAAKTADDLKNLQETILSTEKKLEEVQAEAIDTGPLEKQRLVLEEVIRLSGNLENQQQDEHQKETEAKTLETLLKEKRELLADLRSRREANLAGELATRLEEGKPCSVCGSRDHPSPAVSIDSGATIEAITEAEKELQTAEKNMTGIRKEVAAASARHSETQQALEEKMAQVPEVSLEEAEIVLEQVQNKLAAQAKRSAREKKYTEELKELRSTKLPAAEEANDKTKQAVTNLSLAKVNLSTEADAAARNWENSLDKETRELLGDYREADAEHVRTVIATLQAEALNDTEKADKLEAEQQACRTVLKTREALVDERTDQLERDRGEAEKLRHSFAEALAESEFPDETEFLNALQDKEWREETTKVVADYDQDLRDTKRLIKDLTQRTAGKEQQDLAVLAETRDQAREAHTTSADLLSTITEQRKQLYDLDQKIAECMQQSGDILDDLKRWGKLDNQIRGQGQPRISLKRFFLAQRLEEVLVQASRRMQVLSNGRFILRRAEQAEHRGSQAGLDLQVNDGHTGTDRPVKSLSGGQLFLASLSMALGLADVVQARSGGIRLETLLIDEGFGSLDDETLQLAVKVLNELRQGRMVGVISHITELKRQIATRIEVTEARIGSQATLHVLE